MKTKFGLLLPLGLDPFDKDIDLKSVVKYVDSLWVRDLPVSSKNDGDLGTWYDPFVYLTYLSNNLNAENLKFGIATINCAIRNPIITVKQIASLQYLLEDNMLIGLGSGDKQEILDLFGVNKDEKKERLIKFSHSLYTTLVLGKEDLGSATYSIPDKSMAPNIILASNDAEVWKYNKNVNEWMTRFLSPKIFKEKLRDIKKTNNIKSITLALNIIITSDKSLKIDSYKGIQCLFISPEYLSDFFRIYKNLGVTTFLISILHSNDYIKHIDSISQAINSLNN